MANQEQLDILEQGLDRWNKWRAENPDVQIDLRDANLGFNVVFSGANISGADLHGVRLNMASLWATNFSGANLNDVDLGGADLRGANLSYADLSGAALDGAELTSADLSYADLSGATIGDTVFGDVDLSAVKNLETVHHMGPRLLALIRSSAPKAKYLKSSYATLVSLTLLLRRSPPL
jgi:uncharacterized protein YjbI with pentapeptide repeats